MKHIQFIYDFLKKTIIITISDVLINTSESKQLFFIYLSHIVINKVDNNSLK